MTETQLFHWTLLGLLTGQVATLLYAFYPTFSPKNRCLAGVVGVITLISALRLISTSGEHAWMPSAILVLVIPLGFLIAPLFYLYVAYHTERGFALKPVHGLLTVPFFASWAIILARPLTSERLQSFFADRVFGERWWHCAVIIAIAVGYLLRQQRMIRGWSDAIARGDAADSSPTQLAWIRFLMKLFYLLLIVSTLNQIVGFDESTERWVWASLALLILGITGYGLRISRAWTQDERAPLTVLGGGSSEVREREKDKEGRYKTSNLDNSAITKIQEALIGHVETSKCFLQSNLSLAQLAGRIKVPSHHLSQALNIGMGKNFYDFINDYRVEHAKLELLRPENSSRPILDIAYECGFNSKSVFNAAFKKRTGVTPSSYREKPVNAPAPSTSN